MTVEAATYVADLQAVNPPSTDPRAQGDDHIRLVKQVLQNTFAGASRQWQLPGVLTLSISSSLVKANGEATVYVSTAGGAVVVTLPTLTAADAGWKVHFVKTSADANPVFIAPAAGTLNSGGVAALSRARRCIPGVRSTAIWDGANWFVTRVHALPINSLIEYNGTVLPAGFEWPNGQTLSSAANYPEFNAVTGGLVTPDKRGRLGIPMDNLGGAAAGRLPGGFINGSTFGATGGVDGVTLTGAQIPGHQHNVYLRDPGHIHTAVGIGSVTGQAGASGGGTAPTSWNNISINSNTTGITIGSVSGVANDNLTTSTGGGAAHSNLQPSIMMGQLLVVE